MLNWDDEITAITPAEAKMLRVSLEEIRAAAETLEVQQILQNPGASTRDLWAKLARVYEALVAPGKYRYFIAPRRLAAILRRWVGERRVRFFNDLVSGGSPTVRRSTRSAAANTRLAAPIGAPPQSA